MKYNSKEFADLQMRRRIPPMYLTTIDFTGKGVLKNNGINSLIAFKHDGVFLKLGNISMNVHPPNVNRRKIGVFC